jgi:hypothetical protein
MRRHNFNVLLAKLSEQQALLAQKQHELLEAIVRREPEAEIQAEVDAISARIMELIDQVRDSLRP